MSEKKTIDAATSTAALQAATDPHLLVKYTGDKPWKQLKADITAATEGDFYVKTRADGSLLSLTFDSQKAYDAAKELLAEYIVEDELPRERRWRATVCATIRGLPWLVTTREVVEAFNNLGFYGVVDLKQITSRTRPPVYLFVGPAWHEKNGAIFLVRRLLGFDVTVTQTPAGARRVEQCFRCQKLGHVAKYCRNSVVCVKCGKSHDTRACQKPRDAAPKCANCGGEHVANFRGCQYILEWQPEKKKRRRRRGRKAAKQPERTAGEPRSALPPPGGSSGGGEPAGAPASSGPQQERADDRRACGRDDAGQLTKEAIGEMRAAMRAAADEAVAAFKAAMAAERAALKATLDADILEARRQLQELRDSFAAELKNISGGAPAPTEALCAGPKERTGDTTLEVTPQATVAIQDAKGATTQPETPAAATPPPEGAVAKQQAATTEEPARGDVTAPAKQTYKGLVQKQRLENRFHFTARQWRIIDSRFEEEQWQGLEEQYDVFTPEEWDAHIKLVERETKKKEKERQRFIKDLRDWFTQPQPI